MRYVEKALTAVMVGLSLVGAHTARGQESILRNFTGIDGSSPAAGLLIDAKGDLFGTTQSGGVYGEGTVFELIAVPGGGWTETLIHSFDFDMGAAPSGPLIQDARGNLYGTATIGGDFGYGIVFELSPTAGGSWTETTIYTFGSVDDMLYPTNGGYPGGGVIFDTRGNLYGTTEVGGANHPDSSSLGAGTVFELIPSGGTWTEKVLYSFGATSTDGVTPEAGLVLDSADNLYGTTVLGGTYNQGGTAFELSPGTEGWTEKILHSFNASAEDGDYPQAGLILDGTGNLYGTTRYGGNNSGGTVFELSPASGGAWTERVLRLYENSASATQPVAALTMGAGGNLYGTTLCGGIDASPYGCPNGGGTVFEVLPQPDGSWTETVLHSFPASQDDGIHPQGSVVFDSEGNLYGTTFSSDAAGDGTVFEIAGVAGRTPATTTTLVANPSSSLVAGEAITLIATVTPASGPAVPTGTVTFTDPAFPSRSVTVPLHAGVAVYNGTVPPEGSYSVYASYSGGDGLAPSQSATITTTFSARTTTTLVASPSTNLVQGEPITLTATVTATSGKALPTGTVTFADPEFPEGFIVTPLIGGVAIYRGIVPYPGIFSVNATYNGAPGLLVSSSATITSTVTAPTPR